MPDPSASAQDPTDPSAPRHAWWRRASRGLGWLVLLAVWWHLCVPPLYRWPTPQPFHGDHWYNPYAGDLGDGLRTNLHAHGQAWGGITFAHTSDDAVAQEYRDLGYGLIGLSNYQKLSPRPSVGTAGIHLSVYEHGFGVGQQHQTVVGPEQVSWWEFPLWQGRRQKQFVIERLRRDDALVFLNHPTKNDSYTEQDFRGLGGYHGLEIATGLRSDVHGREEWDAALSAGHPVWGLCSDDYHGEQGEPPGRGSLRVHPPTASEAGVRDALRAGRFTSTWDPRRRATTRLLQCSVENERLTVRLDRPVDRVLFLGQDGRWLAGRRQVSEGTYHLKPDDTYVRVEAHRGEEVLFLNPVLRHDGGALLHPVPERRRASSLGLRLAGVLVPALWWWLRRRRRTGVSRQ